MLSSDFFDTREKMPDCCVCNNSATMLFHGAAVCTQEHAIAFYSALLPSEREQIYAGNTLSDRTIRYCKLDAFNIVDPRTAVNLADKYSDMTLIGKGMLGSFYRAKVRSTNELVSLRIFNSDDSFEDAKREFSNAVKLRRELEHYRGAAFTTHLPEIYDAFYAIAPNIRKLTYAISMEYIPGIPIEDYAHKYGKDITYCSWLRLFQEACSLLEVMQSIGFVHGNINGSTVYVRDSTKLENLYSGFVLLDFRTSCVNNCSKLYSGQVEYMSRELTGFPFDKATKKWIDEMSQESRLKVFQAEDVYAMTTVLFNVLAGVRLSPLQVRILAIGVEYQGTVQQDDVVFLDIVNVKRRKALQKLFALSNHRENIEDLLAKNRSKMTPKQLDLLADIYWQSIAAPIGRRLSASELRELGDELLRLPN